MKMSRKRRTLIQFIALLLVFCLSMTMAGCARSEADEDDGDEETYEDRSDESDETDESDESDESDEADVTPEATPEVTPEVIEETTEPSSDTTPEAGSEADEDGRYLADNKYILNFLAKFSQFSADMGLSMDMESYFFTDNNINQTEEGRISQVGEYFEDGQVMFGMGYNMDNEEMWYVSFEAPLPDLSEWFEKYYFTTIVGLANNPIPLGETEDEIYEFMDSLYSVLVGDGADKAVQMGDYVFVFKNTTEDRAVFAVDALSYFDAFYRGSIDLINLDE